MKIGNTSFNVDAVKQMTFKEFEEAHPHLKGKMDLKNAFKKCGGKIKSSKKEEKGE